MKRYFLILISIFVSISSLWADNGVFGEPKMTSAKALVGHIVIPQTDIREKYYNNTIKKGYFHPDTIWRKRVANPKEGKHYTLDYDYHQPFVGSRFKVISVNDYIGSDSQGFELESIPEGVNIKCRVLTMSHFGMFEVVDVSERLTESNKDKIFYVLKGSYSLDNYVPIVVEQIQYFFDFSYDGKEPEIRVKGHYVSGGDYSYTSKYASSLPFITESDYENRVKEAHISKMNSGKYSLFLSDVIKPKNAKYAKGKIINQSNTRYKYEDTFLAFDVHVTDKQFEFILTNKTSDSFKINWDEALYIDEKNTSQRVIDKGIRLVDRSHPQAPSVVSGGTNCEELLIPVDNIDYSSYSGEWYKENLIAVNSRKGRYPDDAVVKIVFPIETGGKKYEYTFLFGFMFEYSYPEYREQYFKTHPEETE